MTNLLFLSRLYEPHVGGVEKHVKMVAEELMNRGYEIDLMTEQFEGNLKLVEQTDQLTIHRIPKKSLISKKSLWSWIIQQRQLLFHADIIHIHDVFWWIIPVLPFIRHKTWITFHGYEGVNAPGIKQVFWHWIASKLTRGNICIGGFHQKWYTVQPTFTSFGAVEISKQVPIAKNVSHTILFFGRLADDTGVWEYVQAIKLLNQNGKTYSLDVFGDGPLLHKCQEYVKKHKIPVKFFPFRLDIQTIIPKYELVFVSRYLSILECLASGVPVVAQFNNQIKYDYLALSPFADWITIVQSPEEIAQAVLQMQPVKPEAKKWANQQTWEKMADVYEQLWKRKK